MTPWQGGQDAAGVAPGRWIDHVANLSMPNVFMSVGYARYCIIGNTLKHQGAVVIQSPGVISTALIDLPSPFDWGPGVPYLLSIGWHAYGPVIGRVRAVRSGVSVYAGDIIPNTMKAGATPARAAIYQDGVGAVADGSSGGALWNGTTPATWQVGDVWSFSYTAEIA